MAKVQYAVLNDVHFPFESSAYYEALDRCKDLDNLKAIYLNGDLAEIQSVSRHPQHPEGGMSLSGEIEYINRKFDQIQNMFPGIPVHVIEGNHCYRYFRYIRDVCPQMWGVAPMLPDLFNFSDRPNWRWYVYGPTQWVKCGKTRDLYLRHEPLSGGQNHSKQTAERSYVSVLYGHTHTYQTYVCKKIGPKPYNVTATSGGWLGDISKSVFDYRGSKDNWQLGFTIIECDEKTGEYEIRFQYLKDKNHNEVKV